MDSFVEFVLAIFIGLILLWLIFAFVVASKAKRKGRSYVAFLILSIILSPIIGGIILLIVGKKNVQQSFIEDDTKKCPFCAEIIKKDAILCRYCGKDITLKEEKTGAIKKLSNSISKEIKSNRKSLFLFLSCVFMFIPVLLSLFTYTGVIEKTALFVIHYKKEISVTIQPQLLQTILAVILYSSLLIRGIIQTDFKTENNLVLGMELVLHSLNVLFIASFIAVFFDEAPIGWLPIDISPMAILIFGLILSWIGIKSIAGYVWVILFIISMTRVTQSSNAMDYKGTIYVLFAFLSILCQLIPNGSFSSLVQTFNSDFKVAKKEIQEDLHEAKATTEKIITTTIGKTSNVDVVETEISTPVLKDGEI